MNKATKNELQNLLRELCSAQDDVTHYNEAKQDNACRIAQGHRTDVWNQIIAFVEKLEVRR